MKNPNLKNFFSQGGGGLGGDSDQNKTKTIGTIGICLIFVLMRYIKFQVASSSASLVLIQNKRGNRQVRGITLPKFYGIQSKVILT